MSNDIQIHFQLSGQKYDVNLKEDKANHKDSVLIGGIAYSLQGNREGIGFVKECLAQLPYDSMENLSQTGKELKAKLWQAGAKEINLSTSENMHKIGLKIFGNVEPLDVQKIVDDLCSSLEKYYVFPDVAKKCSDHLHKQLDEGTYDSISDPDTFTEVITADLRQISEDKHIVFYLNQPANLQSSEIPAEHGTERYQTPALIHTFAYKSSSDIGLMGASQNSFPYEMKSGFLKEHPSIGYLDLRIFGACHEKEPDQRIAKAEKHLERLKDQRDHARSGPAGREKKRSLNEQIEVHEKRLEKLKLADEMDMQLDVAARRKGIINTVQNLKKAGSIIIDLRNNGGGNPAAVQLMCSLFMDEHFPLNRIEWRVGETVRTEDFSTLAHEALPVEKRLLKPNVFILIGPHTFSAAEEFSNNMKVLGRATVVGEPSGGGANPGASRKIGKDFDIFIPEGQAINPIQKGNWEGVGIIPDYVVPAKEALEQAISLTKNK